MRDTAKSVVRVVKFLEKKNNPKSAHNMENQLIHQLAKPRDRIHKRQLFEINYQYWHTVIVIYQKSIHYCFCVIEKA